ncbi:MAG TPA: hypothetical protein PLQ19_05050 [Aeromicrobium sp.]|nr:hypothetical protein [Aeromicrobium sp.]
MSLPTAHPGPVRPKKLPLRAVLLLPAGAALLLGLDAALLLLKLPAPLDVERLPKVHGMLLVLGFLGTLISLERAIALRAKWGFLAPALLGIGAVLLVTPAPIRVGQAFLILGAALVVAVYVPLWRRQFDEAVLVQLLGAVFALGAAILWFGGVEMPLLLIWLVAFIILTICGERLELARIAMGPNAGLILLVLAAALSVGAAAALLFPQVGSVFFGAALAVLIGWLLRHDVARRTVKTTGLTRYMAVCMLAGYAWALVAAAMWLTNGQIVSGDEYDVVIHAIFLGFTMSMVMAHAPVIFPAVLSRPLEYHWAFYLPVGLLHASLVGRIWFGDFLSVPGFWRASAVLNIVALLLFVLTAATRVVQGAKE